jgi:hypothetical protein
MSLKVENGWFIAGSYDCDPPPMGDWHPLGYHLRAILKTAGNKEWQLAGINELDGKLIKGAALGKEWNCRADNQVSCADALRAAMESYGLFWRLYQDRFGVWQFKKVDLTSHGTFSSSGVGFTNLNPPGRLTICKPIDLLRDSNVHNDFVVIGGKHGEIVRRMPGRFELLKRWKTKTLTNSGLSDPDEVQYALRSLEWMYGRWGRRANFDTFFHRKKEPGQRIYADGGVWEIEGISSASWAQDKARYSVLEV